MYTVRLATVDVMTEAEACHWAWKNCASFKGWKLIEDIKMIECSFTDEQDALLFTLMWAK
jgi:hypothetical protein